MGTTEDKEKMIFEDMLSLYDDAEKMIACLNKIDSLGKIEHFEKLENLLDSLESNVQIMIDSYISLLSTKSPANIEQTKQTKPRIDQAKEHGKQIKKSLVSFHRDLSTSIAHYSGQ